MNRDQKIVAETLAYRRQYLAGWERSTRASMAARHVELAAVTSDLARVFATLDPDFNRPAFLAIACPLMEVKT